MSMQRTDEQRARIGRTIRKAWRRRRKLLKAVKQAKQVQVPSIVSIPIDDATMLKLIKLGVLKIVVA